MWQISASDCARGFSQRQSYLCTVWTFSIVGAPANVQFLQLRLQWPAHTVPGKHRHVDADGDRLPHCIVILLCKYVHKMCGLLSSISINQWFSRSGIDPALGFSRSTASAVELLICYCSWTCSWLVMFTAWKLLYFYLFKIALAQPEVEIWLCSSCLHVQTATA